MSDVCGECGRAIPAGDDEDPIAIAFRRGMRAAGPTLHEAGLLAELWVRSSDRDVRMMGADLKQVLNVSDADA